jgi:hypothetical protein
MFKLTSKWSPVLNEGVPPMESMYYESFWSENTSYIMDGYSIGDERITGDHYWYLNFWKIRGLDYNTGRKSIISPRFLDLDYEYYHVVEQARGLGKNVVVVKARQKGFTEKHAAMGGREFSFFKASQTVFVAGKEFYSDMLYNSCIRGLDDIYETEYYKRRQPNRSDYVRASFIEEQEDDYGNITKVVKGYLSEIYKITAKDNPQAVSSRSPSFIVFEESGVFPGVIETYGYVVPSLVSEGKQTGMAIFVGTGGEMGKGAEELEYIFYNPDEFNCITFDLSQFDDTVPKHTKNVGFFCSAWKYRIIDSDGNSLKDLSTADVMRVRAETKGKQTEYKVIIADPLYPSEAFMIQGGGFFGEQAALLLNARKVKLNQTPALTEHVERGKLEWTYDDHGMINGIEWKYDESGVILIMEHPEWRKNLKDGEEFEKINGMYKGGTDSYDRDEANTSKSKGASYILKDFLNANYTHGFWVARLIDRPEEAEMFFENSAKLHYYYNAMNLIEYSNLRIFDWWKKNGFEELLRERPEFILSSWIKQSKVENRFGIDPNSKVHWLGLLKKKLIDPNFVNNIFDVETINAFLKFILDPKYNCDITIAAALTVVQEQEDKEIITNDKPKVHAAKLLVRYKTVNGRIVKMVG